MKGDDNLVLGLCSVKGTITLTYGGFETAMVNLVSNILGYESKKLGGNGKRKADGGGGLVLYSVLASIHESWRNGVIEVRLGA
ncbi:hypothetical protein N7488_004419 [Penicillium malachiteum]|nr:hypothetical protein N7488_004419 [Penicillium malachiteum]